MRCPSSRRSRCLLAVATTVTLGVTATPASAASCAAHGIVVTPLQSPVFYIDTATSYLGSYVGFRITNSGASAREDVWDRLQS